MQVKVKARQVAEHDAVGSLRHVPLKSLCHHSTLVKVGRVLFYDSYFWLLHLVFALSPMWFRSF